MNTYKTSEIAKMIGLHPNTVRLYENLELISAPIRRANGYRVFTDLHLEQLKLIRLAFQIEVLQNGLRKKVITIVKTSAAREFAKAIGLTDNYINDIKQEDLCSTKKTTPQKVILRDHGNIHLLKTSGKNFVSKVNRIKCALLWSI